MDVLVAVMNVKVVDKQVRCFVSLRDTVKEIERAISPSFFFFCALIFTDTFSNRLYIGYNIYDIPEKSKYWLN